MPQVVQRYTVPERVNHWVVAVSFVLLTLSGLALFQPELFFPVLRPGRWHLVAYPASLHRGGADAELRAHDDQILE